mgnify:CR=1 FL=1
MFTKSKGHRRVTSLFYAMAITLGIYISVNELHFFQNTYNFIVFSVATFFIYIVELFTSFQNKSRKIQINFDYNDEVNELSEVFHKILLPIFLYLSILGFSYFNITNASIYIILAITFVSFYTLILNTKLFLEHEVKEEHKTHYVYDVIKFLIFFLMVNTFANLYKYIGDYIAYFTIGVFAISFLINYLMLIRIKMLTNKFVIQSTLNSAIISLVFLALNLGSKFNALQIALILIFLFYISTAIIHHTIRKTLTREVFLEYMVVTTLLLVIAFLGI